MLEDASISAACVAIWNCSLLANAPRTDSCCPCSCKVRDSVVVVFTLLVFYWLLLPHAVRAGRFFQTVKSFHGGGRLRAKPGMRALAGLQFGVIQLHRQPEQAYSGKTKGAGSQKFEKEFHFPFVKRNCSTCLML